MGQRGALCGDRWPDARRSKSECVPLKFKGAVCLRSVIARNLQPYSGSKICTQHGNPMETWISPVVPWWFNFDPQPHCACAGRFRRWAALNSRPCDLFGKLTSWEHALSWCLRRCLWLRTRFGPSLSLEPLPDIHPLWLTRGKTSSKFFWGYRCPSLSDDFVAFSVFDVAQP